MGSAQTASYALRLPAELDVTATVEALAARPSFPDGGFGVWRSDGHLQLGWRTPRQRLGVRHLCELASAAAGALGELDQALLFGDEVSSNAYMVVPVVLEPTWQMSVMSAPPAMVVRMTSTGPETLTVPGPDLPDMRLRWSGSDRRRLRVEVAVDGHAVAAGEGVLVDAAASVTVTWSGEPAGRLPRREGVELRWQRVRQTSDRPSRSFTVTAGQPHGR